MESVFREGHIKLWYMGRQSRKLTMARRKSTNYNGSHEIKTNMHQDLPNNSATTRYYQEKENTNLEITDFIQHHIHNIYNNLHHFDNDTVVQVDNGNTHTRKKKKLKRSVEVEAFKQKTKKFHLRRNYFMVHHSLIFLGLA